MMTEKGRCEPDGSGAPFPITGRTEFASGISIFRDSLHRHSHQAAASSATVCIATRIRHQHLPRQSASPLASGSGIIRDRQCRASRAGHRSAIMITYRK
ncbi:MAG: hypothetical protein II612_01670 [Prevotella sp.]|nr:hypothetical protein [Prevotella sp.]